MRFELIDQVLEKSADRIVAVKVLSAAEEYLADHFPGFPVMPGVLMLESLVQAARILVADDGADIRPWVLAEARNIRYGNMVRPGQSLRVEVKIDRRDAQTCAFAGTGRVGEQVAVQGRFVLRPVAQ